MDDLCGSTQRHVNSHAAFDAARRRSSFPVVRLSRLCKPEVAGSNPARSTGKPAGNGVFSRWPNLCKSPRLIAFGNVYGNAKALTGARLARG
jgi:hypothetical protein